MREIKFRGIQAYGTKAGRWLYGSLILMPDGDEGFTHAIWCDESLVATNYIYVDPDTVGQFTGLKDRNGKEIYEGDAIRVNDEPFLCDVVWDDHQLQWYARAREDFEFEGYEPIWEYHTFEVIGTIHDKEEA